MVVQPPPPPPTPCGIMYDSRFNVGVVLAGDSGGALLSRRPDGSYVALGVLSYGQVGCAVQAC